jgi:4-amino-4-deoxy-L-arabinose transferase-like glycosyltransferase
MSVIATNAAVSADSVGPIRPRPERSAFVVRGLWVAAAVALVAFTIFWRLGQPALIQADEGRSAEIAREMNVTGSWLVPTLNGIPHLDKPPFFFKLVGLAQTAVGDPEAATRLPSACFAALLLGLVVAFHRAAYGARGDFLAMAILCATPLFLVFARTAILDMTLAFFTCSAIFAGYRAEASDGRARSRWYLVGAASVGIATLIKGPVGFLVPGLVLTLFHLLERRPDALRRLFAPRHALVFLALVLPWFVGVSILHPDFPGYGLIHESLRRYATDEFHRRGSLYFFPVVLVAGCFPWSLLFAESAIAGWRARARLRRADRLCLVWVLVELVFFSISQSKRAGYVLAATVPLAMLIGRVFEAAFRGELASARVVGRASLALALVAAAAAALRMAVSFSPALARSVALSWPDPAEALQRHPVAPVIALFAIAGLGLFAHLRRSARVAFAAFLLFPLAILVSVFPAYVATAESRSSRTLVQAMPALPAGTEVACLLCFPTALPFYLGRTLTVFTKTGNEITSNYLTFMLERGDAWPDGLFPVGTLDAWLDGRNHPVYMIAKSKRGEALSAIAAGRRSRAERLTPDYVGALILPTADR